MVHISSGISALVLAIILGRRRGYEQVTYRIHNIPFVVLGASLLGLAGLDLMQEVHWQPMDWQPMHL